MNTTREDRLMAVACVFAGVCIMAVTRWLMVG